MENPLVAIIMGSDSDISVMEQAARLLEEFQIPFEMKILPAHRTPDQAAEYAKGLAGRGVKVLIAGSAGPPTSQVLPLLRLPYRLSACRLTHPR